MPIINHRTGNRIFITVKGSKEAETIGKALNYMQRFLETNDSKYLDKIKKLGKIQDVDGITYEFSSSGAMLGRHANDDYEDREIYYSG